MRRYLTLALLLILASCVRAQIQRSYADSLARAQQLDSLLQLPDDTTKAALLFRYATEEELISNELARQVFPVAIASARAAAADHYVAMGEAILGHLFMQKAEPDTARTLLTSALAAFTAMGNDRMRASTLNYFSRLETFVDDYVSAVRYAQEARQLAAEIGYPEEEVTAIGSMANVSIATQDQEGMVRYFSEGLAVARENGFDDHVSDMAYQLADYYYRYNYLDKVPPLSAESRAAARRIGDVKREIKAVNVLALYENLQGNPAEAVRLYDTILLLNGGKETVAILGNRAMSYIELGRTEEAAADLEKAIARARKANRLDIVDQVYGVAQQSYANLGRYDSAYALLLRRKLTADTVYADKNTALAKDLAVQYETAEKEAEIARQEADLQRQRNQLYLVGGLGLLTLIGGLIFFNLSRKLRKRNAQNERLVAEKETLIGEIHHRVKNNLQVISSLLQLQSRQLQDENALGALRESQGRVEAMGLIHQKLYQNDDVTSVAAEKYLPELGDMLLDTYRLDNRVEMYYDIEATELDVDVAIPLGLIINELVTNSLKYAFPDDREGTIRSA